MHYQPYKKALEGAFSHAMIIHKKHLLHIVTCKWSASITASPASRLSIPRKTYLPPSFTFTPTLARVERPTYIMTQKREETFM